MAKSEREVAAALEAVKASKTEVSRNKTASAKLLASSKKINKNIETLYEKSKVKADVAVGEFRKNLTAQSAKFKRDASEDQTAVAQIRKDAKQEYRRFKGVYTAAMNANEGVATRHKKVIALQTSASQLHNEISKNATSARNTETQIQELHKTAKKNESEIGTAHTRAKTLGQEIEDTYSLVVDTTLAGTLVQRRDDLTPRVKSWERTYIGSLVLIGAAVILALTVNKPTDLIDIITERFVFITPLAVVAFVAARQFNHERRLLEEYAFKAATAHSLRGYTLLLNEQFKDLPDSRKDILDFTIGAMKNIYDRQPLDGKNGKYHFIVGSKLARIEAKIEEIQHEVGKEKPQIVQKAKVEK